MIHWCVGYGTAPLSGVCALLLLIHFATPRPPRGQADLETSQFNWPRLLAPAPDDDSQQTRVDVAELLRIQSRRTAEQCERARADNVLSVYRFADALGSPAGFAPQRLPKFDRLFARLLDLDVAAFNLAKQAYRRPRPYVLDTRIEPCIEKPKSASYPSGHSIWAFSNAIVLADMVPERRAALMQRAGDYAHNRVIGGVHYTSDIEAGRIAGTAIAALLFASPTFQHDFAAARVELRAALDLPP